VRLADDQQLIQTLATQGAYQTFRIPVLPGRPRRSANLHGFTDRLGVGGVRLAPLDEWLYGGN
jgi:hypothetical protein